MSPTVARHLLCTRTYAPSWVMVFLAMQGNVRAHDQRDIRSSVAHEQHDWQPVQAAAPKPETLSLQQEMQKTYTVTTVINKMLSCCCDSRSYRVQIRSPHTSAHALQSALGSLGTRIGGRTEWHCADWRPYKRRYMCIGT